MSEQFKDNASSDSDKAYETSESKYNFISIQPVEEGKSIITLDQQPKLIGKLVKRGSGQVQYIGSGTVWFNKETGERAGSSSIELITGETTLLESYLFEVWKEHGGK